MIQTILTQFTSVYAHHIMLCVACIVTGELLFALLRIKPSGDQWIHLFEKLVFGLITLVSIYAIYKTTGKTILWAAVLPFLFMKKNDKGINWQAHLLVNLKLLVFLALVFVPFSFYFLWVTHDIPTSHLYDHDFLFYKSIGDAIAKTGVESYLYLHHDMSLGNPPRTPYHYFDVWLVSMFDFPPIENVWGLVMPFLSAASAFGIFSFARSSGLSNLKSILLMGLIFVAPLGAVFSLQFHIRPMMAMKYMSLFLVFLLFVTKWLREKAPNHAILLLMPGLSVLTAPGILGGVFLHGSAGILMQRKGEKSKEHAKNLLLVILIAGIFLLTYAGQKTPYVSANGLGDFLVSIISIKPDIFLIKTAGQIYSFLLTTTVGIVPYFLCLLLVKDLKNKVRQQISVLGLFACIAICAMLPASLLWIHRDGFQFYYTFLIFLCALVVSMLVYTIAHIRYQWLLLLILLLPFAYLARAGYFNITTSFTKNNRINSEDALFRTEVIKEIEQLMAAQPHIKPLPIFQIKGNDHFNKNIFNYNLAVHASLSFLHLRYDHIKSTHLHAYDMLKIHDEKINNRDEAYSIDFYVKHLNRSNREDLADKLLKIQVLMIASGHYYHRFTDTLAQPYHVDEARDRYIDAQAIPFGFADRCDLIPKKTMDRATKVIVNQGNQECFISLVPTAQTR